MRTDAPQPAGDEIDLDRPHQFALLRTRRFLPLFLVQFLGAFNDQVYQKAFVALLTYRLAEDLDTPLALLGVIASGLFILPFAVVTPTAGQIADRMDKAKMMKVVKFWEIIVMVMAVVGFYSQNIVFLYFVLFLMGAQSAMFAPIKYSVLPQYLKPNELLGGNGMVQAFTFLAIIFGTILGTELVLVEFGVPIVSAFVVTVAVIGWIASLYAPPAPPTGPAVKVDLVFPRAIWRLIAASRQEEWAWRSIRFIAWFWFLGATFLSLLPAYARDQLQVDEGVLTVLLTAFSVGVAIGALLSEKLSDGRVGCEVAPIGALGIAIMSVELWFATAAAPLPPEGTLWGRGDALGSLAHWRIIVDFAVLAAFAGLYVTPLNALLQTASPEGRRARFIACSNVVDASAMVLSAATVAACIALGLRSIDVLSLFGLSGLAMALIVGRHAPATRLGRVALSAWPRPPEA
jgi:MFS family permease